MKKKSYSVEYIEKLRNAYIIEKKSTTEIAKDSVNIFGMSISPATIYKDIVNNNIPLRSKAESVSMATGELDKSKVYMTENLLEWVDGLMLGDGYINFKKPLYTTSRFRIDSSSKEWVIYALSKFLDYKPSEPKVYSKISEKCPNEIWMATTLTHPDITTQARRWYSGSNQTKKIPVDVRITPISVMLWYLGDGSFHYEPDGNMSILRLATCAFDKVDLETIVIPKLKAHKIDCYVDDYKNDIHIRAESIKDFFNFIGWKSPISCYDHKFAVPEWLKLTRLSEIVDNDKQRWMAQYYYKSGQLECSKSPGGKMLLFTREQADKLKMKLNSTL
jgi:hypothetical protein